MDKGRLTIEYCTGCRWMMRAAWMLQELLVTFEDEIDTASLKPGKGGVFNIYVNDQIIFSRSEKKRFPQLKEIKQLVRNIVAPDKSLGHSDKN